MKRYLLLLIAIICHNLLLGQISNVVFAGAATTKDGNTYTYKLLLTDSNNVLSGYSVTDVMGPDETKTTVRGTIEASKKQIEFRETNILYSKSPSQPGDMCYVHAKLRISSINGTTALKGNFDSYRKNGEVNGCPTGKLALVCAKDVYNKLLELRAKDSARKAAANTHPSETAIPPAHILKVLPGRTIEVVCAAKTMSLDIWDMKSRNGDVITIKQNGLAVLEDHTVSNKHKIVNIKMGSKSAADTLTVSAVSVGEENLAAAPIKLLCGDDAWFIDAIAAIGHPATIILKRK